LLLVPGAAWGQKEARARHVHDEAKLFSKDAIDQANKTIEKIKKAHGKDLFIESVESGEKEKDLRTKWAKTRFNDFGIDGIYIVVSKEPSFYRFYVGDNTREKGYFSKANIDKMDEDLKPITKPGKRDEALIEAANYVLEAMNEHARSKGKEIAPKKVAAPPVQVAQPPVIHHNNAAAQDNAVPEWVGWVCMIAVILLVVWVVFAIIRAMTGMMMGGGGGYGYGGGGGYGYGGGGGSFFTGMLGGMFGSMAGMWMYNNMFGGHATYGQNGAVNWGGGDQGSTGSAAAPYEADTADGGTGGGGDDDAGSGGDAGGGGNDAGGGDDDAGGGGAAGGGDDGGGGGGWFGGGGGGGDDAGGGGGGWFGGGGGDAGGGGGGDWGGGGGGGDFGGGGGGGGGGDW
jgi:uncharacterized protein